MQRAVDQRARTELRRQREAGAHVTLAPTEHRGVDGDHDPLVAGRLGALQHVLHQDRGRATRRPGTTSVRPTPPPPLRWSGCSSSTACTEERPRRQPGDGELAVRSDDAGEPGRRQDQWQRQRATEERTTTCRWLPTSRSTRGRNSNEANPATLRVRRELVLRAAVHIVEHPARQTATSDTPQVVDRRDVLEPPLGRGRARSP